MNRDYFQKHFYQMHAKINQRRLVKASYRSPIVEKAIFVSHRYGVYSTAGTTGASEFPIMLRPGLI